MIALNPADGTQVDLSGIVTQEQQNADPSTTLLVGADGKAYLRSGHALIELRAMPEGMRPGRKVEPNTGGLNLFFPTDAGVPAAGEDWLLYASSFRDTRLLRVHEQGGITANGSVRQRESRMIGLDAAGTAYICGLRSVFPECVALTSENDTPLWSVVLEQRGKVVGGALTADGLYVATDTGALVLLGR